MSGLRARREAAHLTRAELAIQAGCSASLIKIVERGYVCSAEQANALAGALRCAPSDLWVNDEGPGAANAETLEISRQDGPRHVCSA